MPVEKPSTKTESLSGSGYSDFSHADNRFFLMELTRAQLQEITELFEDSVEYYCDSNLISGQKLWTVLECLSAAKLAELNGELTQ